MQPSLDSKHYVVRQGDTLTSIAKQFGFANWNDIYRSPANAAFRARRPNPNQINAGDQIMLPPTPQAVRQILQARLNSLVLLRSDTAALYQAIEKDMDDNIRRYDNVSRSVDAVATVANVLTGLGKIVVQGMAAMKLSGAALTEANKELGKETLKLAVDPLKDPALKYTADRLGTSSGIVWAVGKITIESWLNLNSPGWWGGVAGNLRSGKSWSQAVTSDPLEALRAARDNVDRQRLDTLNRIDEKIQETRALLNGVSANGLTSFYDKGMQMYA